MSYKKKLGIQKGNYIFSNEIDEYFKSLGFYEDDMNPRFMNGHDYEKLAIGVPVLRHDSEWRDGYTVRVFMNQSEIYLEVQTPYRSYEASNYNKFKETPNSIEEIESALDELTERL